MARRIHKWQTSINQARQLNSQGNIPSGGLVEARLAKREL